MATQRVLTDVPEEEINEVVSDFESEGATITKVKQSNGNWTISARFSIIHSDSES